jgi:hypothetical protein
MSAQAESIETGDEGKKKREGSQESEKVHLGGKVDEAFIIFGQAERGESKGQQQTEASTAEGNKGSNSQRAKNAPLGDIHDFLLFVASQTGIIVVRLSNFKTAHPGFLFVGYLPGYTLYMGQVTHILVICMTPRTRTSVRRGNDRGVMQSFLCKPSNGFAKA